MASHALKNQILDNEPLSWRDGIPYSSRFNDIYFSNAGGLEESKHVFLGLNNLPTRWRDGNSFSICELGFGTGLNFLLSAQCWQESSAPDQLLHYVCIEKFPLSTTDLEAALKQWPELSPLASRLLGTYPALVAGTHRLSFPEWRINLTLHFGEALEVLKKESHQFDAWYLDGFSPAKNNDLWSKEICQEMARLSHPETTVATYSVASAVRENLADSGFKVEKVPGYGQKKESLQGQYSLPRELNHNDSSPPWFRLPNANRTRGRVLVIGAGLAGTAAAFSLSRRGFEVLIIEAETEIAQHASGNLQGSAVPYLSAEPTKMSAFYLQGLSLAAAHLRFLNSKVSSPLWHECGALQLPSSERLERLCDTIAAADLNRNFVRVVNQTEASALSGITLKSSAIYFPRGGYALPQKVCAANINASGRTQLIKSSAVKRLEKIGENWRAICAKGTTIAEAEIVVVANGSSASDFEQLNWLPTERVRGQLIELTANATSSKLKTVLCYDGYLFPEFEGHQVLGATFEHGDFSAAINEDHNNTLLNRLAHWADLFPLDTKGDARVSFRVSSHDRFPYIGAVPEREFFLKEYVDFKRGFPPQRYKAARHIPGLYVSASHGSRGIISTHVAGEILAALICGEPQPVNRELVDAVNPARAIMRELR